MGRLSSTSFDMPYIKKHWQYIHRDCRYVKILGSLSLTRSIINARSGCLTVTGEDASASKCGMGGAYLKPSEGYHILDLFCCLDRSLGII